MAKQPSGFGKRQKRTAPREIGPSGTTTSRAGTEEVVFDHTLAAAVIWPEERSLDLDGAHIEGWVAGFRLWRTAGRSAGGSVDGQSVGMGCDGRELG